jgi:hypothetical protein
MFNERGIILEGIFKDNSLFNGRKWVLNDTGSYDLKQFTNDLIKEKEV